MQGHLRQGRHRHAGEDHVSGAGAEIPKPPSLPRRRPGQQREHGPVMPFLVFTVVRPDDGGAGVEDRRDRGGDSQARGSSPGNPRHLGVSPYAPRNGHAHP
jgi:hypothetical protein